MTTLSESRANQLWASFAGMFGGETLTRKYGKTVPREWVEMVGRLKDYELQRGMRRVVASGTEHVPTLPQFRRFCQESKNDDIDAPTSNAIPQLPSNLASQDAWEVLASMRLLKYIHTRLGKEPLAFGSPSSEQQQHCASILVHWKKYWAQMMREEATADGVDGKYQREIWDSYMVMAEQEIATNVFAKSVAA